MPSTGSREPGRSVLPSFATPAIAVAAAWVSVAPYVWTEAGQLERALTGPLPGAVVLGFALGDYVLWRSRGRPWHDWHVIVLLLPAIAAGVWVAVGRPRPRRRVLARGAARDLRRPGNRARRPPDDDDLLPRAAPS